MSDEKDEITEYFDCESELRRKVSQIVELIKACNENCTRDGGFVVFHTGAGISTSCGIPDYRGPNGVWTLRDKGIKIPRRPPGEWYPSKTHCAIAELLSCGIVRFVVSQNVDGLHVKSGVEPEQLAELHGNSFRESCKKCHTAYYRNFSVRNHANSVHKHKTTRTCSNCGGNLYDTIVNFGESLPEDELDKATWHSSHAGLSVVIGTSLKVTPAADLPPLSPQLVIVNLQKTPLDWRADVRVFAKADDFFHVLMEQLSVHIPKYIFRGSIAVGIRSRRGESGKFTFYVENADDSTLPVHYVSHVEVRYKGHVQTIGKQPFTLPVSSKEVKYKLRFCNRENAGEMPLVYRGNGEQEIVRLEYDKDESEWKEATKATEISDAMESLSVNEKEP